ncbi:hypothetical protein IV38_GL000596 [Lactobacillus selangorensis]|uniref:Integral membrane protein n=1 Tax=Lactobacillus selangorensis TaxID=81857 RepID=A0A0R2FWN7_9LACO|nr:YfhO family protein [Lactobacillus selangorensis]KRN29708.1 hypothetical protein IV38_GL000596 [Lactobacillus selangorensis]KRN33763.1 hypothetical protein IV40_GL000072 [Lactobacillus selangorensis]
MRFKKKRSWPIFLYGLSFALPLLIMGIYAIYRGVFPFGKSSWLTVDLGQQYIDFFAYFRSTLLHHPSTFLYSFSKALGGGMIGSWAYYLMSPFNLILLLTPGKWLTFGVVLVILLKYACSGWSFAFFLRKSKLLDGLWVPAFATAYALMGFTIANQLNLMWLDAVVFLPLIALGIQELFVPHHFLRYPLMLGALLIVNYYMGWMVCLFSILYFIWQLAIHRGPLKRQLQVIGKFIGGSLLAGGIGAWLLLPSFFDLLQGKGQYTVHTLNWKLEYKPFKLLAKFVVGAFNFDQMPKGQPNLFIGMLPLVAALLYFMQKRYAWQERLTALVITAFLIASLFVEPLDLLWHGGQFPVWYPYRFSYIVSFWLLVVAARALSHHPDIKLWQLIVCSSLFAAMMIYLMDTLKHISYLKTDQVLISFGFGACALLLLAVGIRRSPIYQGLILLLAVVEMTTNAYMSLNNISYLTQSDYAAYTSQLQKEVNKLPENTHRFYRVGKTFNRTKNDALETGYYGASHFNSVLEAQVPTFMGNIGQPSGYGVVNYSNGTLWTDALLDMKYYLAAKAAKPIGSEVIKPLFTADTNKPDLAYYRLQSADTNSSIYKNPYALSLGFAASANALTERPVADQPITEQTNMFHSLISATTSQSPLYAAVPFDETVLHNVKRDSNFNDANYTKVDSSKPASVDFYFTPQTDEPYYLTLGNNLSGNVVNLQLNGETLTQYSPFNDPVVINVAAGQKGQRQKLTISFTKDKTWLQDLQLYQFQLSTFDAGIAKLKQHPLKISHFSNNKITGTITTTKQQPLLMTTIPYNQGWHLKVDGKAVATKRVFKMFLAAKLKPGHHQIELTYWPPYLTLGMVISLLSLGIVGVLWKQPAWLPKKKKA